MGAGSGAAQQPGVPQPSVAVMQAQVVYIHSGEGKGGSGTAACTSDSFQLAAGAWLHGSSLHVCGGGGELRQCRSLRDKEGNEGETGFTSGQWR